MNDKGQQFYEYLKSSNIEVPASYAEFQSAMQDQNTASQFYDFVKSQDIDVPETSQEFQSVFSSSVEGEPVNFTNASDGAQEQSTSTFQQGSQPSEGGGTPFVTNTPEYLKSPETVKAEEQRGFSLPEMSEEERQNMPQSVVGAIESGQMYQDIYAKNLEEYTANADQEVPKLDLQISELQRGLGNERTDQATLRKIKELNSKRAGYLLSRKKDSEDVKDLNTIFDLQKDLSEEDKKAFYPQVDRYVKAVEPIIQKAIDEEVFDMENALDVQPDGTSTPNVAFAEYRANQVASKLGVDGEALNLISKMIQKKAKNYDTSKKTQAKMEQYGFIDPTVKAELDKFNETVLAPIKSDADEKVNSLYEESLRSAAEINAEYKARISDERYRIQMEITVAESRGEIPSEKAREILKRRQDQVTKNLQDEQSALLDRLNLNYNTTSSAIRDNADKEYLAQYNKFSKDNNLEDRGLNYLQAIQKRASEEVAAEENMLRVNYEDKNLTTFTTNFMNSMASSLSGTAQTLGFDGLVPVFDQMAYNNTPAMREYGDGDNWSKFSQTVGNLAGSQATQIPVQITVSALTGGFGTIGQMIAAGATGWALETASITGNMYNQTLMESGNIQEARRNAKQSYDAQVSNLWMYGLDGLPFVGKALNRIGAGSVLKTGATRFLAGGAIESGTETLQETVQGAQELAIVETGNYKNFDRYITPDFATKTFLEVAPTFFLGGGGQIVSTVRENAGGKRAAKEFTKEDVNDYIKASIGLSNAAPDVVKQVIYNTYLKEGFTFTAAMIEGLKANGTITSERATELGGMLKDQMNMFSTTKSLGLTPIEGLTYYAISDKYRQLKEQADAIENDDIAKGVIMDRANKFKQSASDFLADPKKGGSYVTVTTPNRPDAFLSAAEFKSFVEQDGVAEMIEGGKITYQSRNVDGVDNVVNDQLEKVAQSKGKKADQPQQQAEPKKEEEKELTPEENLAKAMQDIDSYIGGLVSETEEEVFGGKKVVDSTLDKMNNAEYVNDDEIEESKMAIDDEITRINSMDISDNAKKNIIDNLEQIKQELDNYEFRTKTNVIKTPAKPSTKGDGKVTEAAPEATKTKSETTAEVGGRRGFTITFLGGNKISLVFRNKPTHIKNKSVSSRTTTFTFPKDFLFMDEEGNFLKLILRDAEGNRIVIRDPEVGVPLALQNLRALTGPMKNETVSAVVEEQQATVTTEDVNYIKENKNAVQEQTTSEVPVQPEAKVGEKMAEGEPQAETKVAAEEGKKADIERRRKEELDAVIQTAPIEILDEKGNVVQTTDKRVVINAKYDAELAALEEAEPKPKEAAKTAKEKLKERSRKQTILKQIENAKKAIARVAKGVEIIVATTPEHFEILGGDKGAYVKGKIYINLDKADFTTVAHEVFHGLLLHKGMSDAMARRLTENMFKTIRKTASQDLLARLDKFASMYDEGLQSEESMGQLFGIIAESYAEMDGGAKSAVRQWLDGLIKALGLEGMFPKDMSPLTASDKEVLNFLNTVARKVATGEEVTDQDVAVLGEGSETATEQAARFQADFSDRISKMTFTYDKNTAKFKRLEKNGNITRNKSIVDFNNKYVFFHQPDAAFSGLIYKNGQLLVEGKGGMYYPIKFHEDGYFWASTESAAIKMASDLNKVYDQNGGTIYMALTSAPYDKLMSSTTMSNAILDFFSSKVFDETFKISPSQLKKSLIYATNNVTQKTVNGRIKEIGLNLGLKNNQSLEEIQNKIKSVLAADKSTFDSRKQFVKDLIKMMAQEINSNEVSITEFGKLFSEGIQNKYFKGISKNNKIKISAANMSQALSEMFTEPMLKDDVNREKGGQIYAILELSSKVKTEDSNKHESYPKTIVADGGKVKLHILKDRVQWSDVTEDFETKDLVEDSRKLSIFPTSGVSVKGLKINTSKLKSEQTPRKQRIDKASDKLKKLFDRDNIPLTITEAKEMVEEVYDWTTWYDGLSSYVYELFDEYGEDILSLLPLSSMAANSAATVGMAINNVERIYKGEKPAGVAEYYGYVTDFLEGKGIKSDKMYNFFKALSGDKNAIAVDMHVYSIIMGKDPNKKQVNPANKKEFDKAKEFVNTLATELELAPREVQAALWALNILRTGGKPDSYEQYFEKQVKSKNLKQRIQGWREQNYKPFSELRKTREEDLGLQTTRKQKPSIQEMIDFAKEEGISKKDLRDFLKEEGYSDAAIKEALPRPQVRPPSARRVLGQPKPKKVTVQEMAALKDQIRLEARAARGAVSFINKIRRDIQSAIEGLQKIGKLSTKQVNSITNKLNKVNLLNPIMRERFIDYMEKVYNNAEYAAKLSQARATRAKVKKKIKSEGTDAVLGSAAKVFAKVDPSMVDDIDAYNELADKVLSGLSSSRVGGSLRSAFDIDGVLEYANKKIEEQDKAILNKLKETFEEITGTDPKDMTYAEMMSLLEVAEDDNALDDKSKQVRAVADAYFDLYSKSVSSMISDKVDPFTGEDIEVDPYQAELMKRLMSLDRNNFTTKELVQAVDILNNFVVNGKVGGVEKIVMGKEGLQSAQGLKGLTQKAFRFFTKKVGRIEMSGITSLNLLFERKFGGFSAGQKVMKAMGLQDLKKAASTVMKTVDVAIVNYYDKFGKTKPNGEEFNSAYNNAERGLYASLKRTVNGTAEEQAAEFKRMKNLWKESTEYHKNGTEKEKVIGEKMQKAYAKIAASSNSIAEVESKMDATNKQATEYWMDKFKGIKPSLDQVSLSMYNTVLEDDLFYTPITTKRKVGEDGIVDDNVGSFSALTGNSVVAPGKAGQLKQINRPATLSARYLSPDFDTNMANAYNAALMDISTAPYISKIKGFMNSKEGKALFGSQEDYKVVVKRVQDYINAKRGQKRFSTNKDFDRVIDLISKLGATRALGSITQPVKQTIPVAINAMIASNPTNFLIASGLISGNKDAMKFLEGSGYAIAVRGASARASIDSMDQQVSKLLSKTNGDVGKAMELISGEWLLNNVLVKPDVFVAKVSWMSFYLQNLNKQGVKTGNIDWATHKINTEAAEYAQGMVDRSQNVSDSDLQGSYFTDPSTSMKFVRGMFPFMTFILNQKERMYSDIITISSLTSSKEDKETALRSLMGTLAEIGSFSYISYYISAGTFTVAAAMIGYDEPEEEKKKRLANLWKGKVTSFTSDILSPFPPVSDYAVMATINAAANATYGEDVVYEPRDKSLPEQLGVFGITASKALDLEKLLDMAYDGKFMKESFGKETEKTLTQGQQDSAKLASALLMMHLLGAPSDLGNVSNYIRKTIEKNSSTVSSKTKSSKEPTKKKIRIPTFNRRRLSK